MSRCIPTFPQRLPHNVAPIMRKSSRNWKRNSWGIRTSSFIIWGSSTMKIISFVGLMIIIFLRKFNTFSKISRRREGQRVRKTKVCSISWRKVFNNLTFQIIPTRKNKMFYHHKIMRKKYMKRRRQSKNKRMKINIKSKKTSICAWDLIMIANCLRKGRTKSMRVQKLTFE